jgi:hypothetical protein
MSIWIYVLGLATHIVMKRREEMKTDDPDMKMEMRRNARKRYGRFPSGGMINK